MRWVGHVARVGDRRDVYRLSVEKLEGTRPLGRARHRYEDNIKIGLQVDEMGTWTGLVWSRIGTGLCPESSESYTPF